MCGLPLEYGWLTKGYSVRENWPFISQQLKIASSSSARGGTSCPPPSSVLGFYLVQARAGLVNSAAGTVSSLCVAVLLWRIGCFLWSSVSFDSHTYPPLFCRDPWIAAISQVWNSSSHVGCLVGNPQWSPEVCLLVLRFQAHTTRLFICGSGDQTQILIPFTNWPSHSVP